RGAARDPRRRRRVGGVGRAVPRRSRRAARGPRRARRGGALAPRAPRRGRRDGPARPGVRAWAAALGTGGRARGAPPRARSLGAGRRTPDRRDEALDARLVAPRRDELARAGAVPLAQ